MPETNISDVNRGKRSAVPLGRSKVDDEVFVDGARPSKRKRGDVSPGASHNPSQEHGPSDDFISVASSVSSSEQTGLVPNGMMPNFLADAFSDLYAQDGLVVLGKGLGMLQLLASFVRFYADVKDGYRAMMETSEGAHKKTSDTKSSKPPLVLVLGLKEGERSALVKILQSWGTPTTMLPTIITTTETAGGKDRATQYYNRGGVFCITSRILIVDLLTNVVSSNDIDGILVAHAEHLTSNQSASSSGASASTEAFILRIYNSQKRPYGSGFVKAFSDEPDLLMSGFAKIDKIMKALFVQKLYLYPRFQHSIREELECAESAPNVIELHHPLSQLQQQIQNAIVAAVKSCIRELKSQTTLLEWTDSDLSIENCVTTNFDRAIQKQLEHDWYRVQPQTKQLVQDLRTLRTLFQYLLQYDCISFWILINNLKMTSAKTRYPSMWLLTPAADLLFRKAKERIYKIHRHRPTSMVPNPVSHLVPILEENPKWKLLRSVMQEVEQDYRDHHADEKDSVGPTTVLVMAKDDRTVETLRSYLTENFDSTSSSGKNSTKTSRTMLLRWLNYLEDLNERSRSKHGADDIPEEDRLLLEEEGRVRRVLFSSTDGPGNNGSGKRKESKRKGGKVKTKLNQVPQFIKKRRRVAAEKGRGKSIHQSDDLEREATLDDAVEATEQEIQASQNVSNELENQQGRDNEELKESDGDADEAKFRITFDRELRIVLKSYSSIEGDDASLLLHDVRPRYVVLYDTEVSFIRSIEVYAALQGPVDRKLRVYFLMFEASSEEKNFMKSLEREQNAFERLIHHKKHMPPPAIHVHSTQEMQQAVRQGIVDGSYMGGTLPLAFDSRSGRGKVDKSKIRRDIAVDVREFRSALPSILHQGGMRLAPVTLTVGDFVLSNVHCVERKSISDLFGSFQSGRLYTQAEAMCKYYKCPCLLIEFDPQRSFSLQSSNDIGPTIKSDSVCSKISVLVMHFPRLRILWSRGPHETLRIFRDLKSNHEEVDVDRALEIGRNESIESLLQPSTEDDGEDEEEEINETARDMLLRLPGVNVHSARRIMQECDSLAELSELSRDDLRRIAGPATGQKLFTFFRQQL